MLANLVIRRNSAYSYRDIIIGIYSDDDKAFDASDMYIDIVGRCHDKYAIQAYHDVNLEEDIEIIEIKIDNTVLDYGYVYILNEYACCFGQVHSKAIYFCTSFKQLLDKLAIIENEEKKGWQDVHYEYDVIVMDDIRYDNHLNWLR